MTPKVAPPPVALAAILISGRPLEPADVEALELALETPDARRRRRLDARNVALRAVALMLDAGSAYRTGAAVSAELRRYLSRAMWRRHRTDDHLPLGARTVDALLHAVAWHGDGADLGPRQVANILQSTGN